MHARHRRILGTAFLVPFLVGGGLVVSQAVNPPSRLQSSTTASVPPGWTASSGSDAQSAWGSLTEADPNGTPFTGSVDLKALMYMDHSTLDQAKEALASSWGLSAAPTRSSGVVKGKTYGFVGSSPMTVRADSGVTKKRNAHGDIESTLTVGFTEPAGPVKVTSLPDPVATYLAAYPTESRADALKFWKGDPLAQRGALLPSGTLVAPTEAPSANPSATAATSRGPVIQVGCYEVPPPSFLHWHPCFIVSMDQGARGHVGTWYVDEEFSQTFRIDATTFGYRHPTYADLWMAHYPNPINLILDETPASDKSSENGCTSFGFGLDLAVFKFSYDMPVCDGTVGPNGPRSDWDPDGAGPKRAGPLFGPKWIGNYWTAQNTVNYEVRGTSFVRTNGTYFGGKSFVASARWVG